MKWLFGGIIGLIAGAIRGMIGYVKKENEQFNEGRFVKTIILSMIFGMVAGAQGNVSYAVAYAIAGETIITDMAEILYNKRS